MSEAWRPPTGSRLAKIWSDLKNKEGNLTWSSTECNLLLETNRLTLSVQSAQRRLNLYKRDIEEMKESLEESHVIEAELLLEVEESEEREKKLRQTCRGLKSDLLKTTMENSELKKQLDESKEQLKKSEALKKKEIEAEIQKRKRMEEDGEQASKNFNEHVGKLMEKLDQTILEKDELVQKNKDLEEKLAAAPPSPPPASPKQHSPPTTPTQPDSPQQQKNAPPEECKPPEGIGIQAAGSTDVSKEEEYDSSDEEEDDSDDDSKDALYKPEESFARQVAARSGSRPGGQSRIRTRRQTQAAESKPKTGSKPPVPRQSTASKPRRVVRKGPIPTRLTSNPLAANNLRVQSASDDEKEEGNIPLQSFVIPTGPPPTRQSAKKRKLAAKSTTSSSALLDRPDDMEEDGPQDAKSRRGKEKAWQVSVK